MTAPVTLVTGGAGFIGSHLVDHLLAAGTRVRVLDNLDPLAHPAGKPPAHLAADAELMVGDVGDPDAAARALDGVEEVFHLGGVVGNGESLVNVRRCVDANCAGTATLLEEVIARRDRVRRVVAASSVVVYGDGVARCAEHGELPVPVRPRAQLRRGEWEPQCPRCGRELEPLACREEQALRPQSVYAITKRDQEELVLTLGHAYGIEAVALRFNNVYGTRQALGNPYTGVAATFAARALTGRAPVVFEDGGQRRDLVHVSDAVRACAAAMRSPGAVGRAINVASGRIVTVGELARAVLVALGAGLEPELTGEHRVGDVRHWFADPALARELLGFRARRTLADELPELVAWAAGQHVEVDGDGALAQLRARGLVSRGCVSPPRGSCAKMRV
jgi:dTDP-L-rhamnose 4-epimerase